MANNLMTPRDQAGRTEWRDRPVAAPTVDIFESKEEFLLFADMPGVAKDAITLHYEKGRLTVEGKRHVFVPGDPIAAEYRPADFRRVFALPYGVDGDHIEADLEGGVLRVRLPKSEAFKPRQIAVRGG